MVKRQETKTSKVVSHLLEFLVRLEYSVYQNKITTLEASGRTASKQTQAGCVSGAESARWIPQNIGPAEGDGVSGVRTRG